MDVGGDHKNLNSTGISEMPMNADLSRLEFIIEEMSDDGESNHIAGMSCESGFRGRMRKEPLGNSSPREAERLFNPND
jgi:hypothetical protein